MNNKTMHQTINQLENCLLR